MRQDIVSESGACVYLCKHTSISISRENVGVSVQGSEKRHLSHHFIARRKEMRNLASLGDSRIGCTMNPTKERVRKWLSEEIRKKRPPDRKQIRRELGWDLISPARKKLNQAV